MTEFNPISIDPNLNTHKFPLKLEEKEKKTLNGNSTEYAVGEQGFLILTVKLTVNCLKFKIIMFK